MTKSICLALLLLAFCVIPAQAADIDFASSMITVHVEKSGLFSAFAHNHVISAPLASGHLDAEKRTIELDFRSQQMKVLDPDASVSERAQIENTMKGSLVLDPARFPEITFISTAVEPAAATAAGTAAPTHYLVRGNLTLHGVTRPVELNVSFSEGNTPGSGHYTGKVTLKQTDFGITPVKIAGGAVRVKDVIEIVFDIAAK